MSTHGDLIPVETADAPAAVGPYSQGIRVGDLLFVSGSLGLVPSTGKLIEGGIGPQTFQALSNVGAIVAAGGSDLGRVIKTTVFLADMDDFATVNKIYGDFFQGHKPARSAAQAAKLPLGALIEIEAIASVA